MNEKTKEKSPDICAKCGKPVTNFFMRKPLGEMGTDRKGLRLNGVVLAFYLGEDWAKKKLCVNCFRHCLECGAKLPLKYTNGLCTNCSASFAEHKAAEISNKFAVWTCEYCRTENKKNETRCSGCGAGRKTV
ncbi:MAG: hypothetical protein WED07_04400 [Candidatus Freyarchaeum deiterrae]